MNLTLQNLRPRYLPEKPSDIWGQELSFAHGERIFVCAPSGKGKTSLIHLLYGLRHDTEGEIFWDDKPLFKLPDEQLAALRAQKLSIVFQDLRLFPQLTLWENLLIKKALGSPVSDSELESWLERLGLTHRRDSLAQNLSYGEQQRTALLRALIPHFQWLLLDEPFSHLDAENAGKALILIEEIANQRGAGILYAELDDNPQFHASQKLLL